jgi:hypothetical protein
VASSVYAVRFGQSEADQAVTGLFNGNHPNAPAGSTEERIFSVKRLGEQQAKPAHRVRIEGFLGVGICSAARPRRASPAS